LCAVIAARVAAGIASRVTHSTGCPDFAAQPAAGIAKPGCSDDATTTAPDGLPAAAVWSRSIACASAA
jgi:hypothetical protein